MRLLDFTKRRKGSIAEDGRRIELCPKCGRKGTVSRYKNGSGLCVHTAENHGFALGVRDFCSLAKPSPHQFCEHCPTDGSHCAVCSPTPKG